MRKSLLRFVFQFWRWLHRPRFEHVSDTWLREHVGRWYDDNPRARSNRKE